MTYQADFYLRLNHHIKRLNQEIAFRTGAPVSKPTNIIILLTNRCNARCIHCNSWKLPKQVEEMTSLEWKNTIREMRSWLGPSYISMTGGEQLLRQDSLDVASYAAELGFYIEFLTNGFAMNETTAGRLVRSGVRRIRISLDGSKAEIHDTVRGKKGFFEKATQAFRMLAAERAKSKRKVRILARTTIMSLNVEDLPRMPVLVKELGIDGVEFQALEPVYYSEQLGNSNWYRNNPLWIRDLKTLSESIGQLKQLKNQGYPVLNSLENFKMIEDYFAEPEKLSFKVHTHNYNNKTNTCTAWPGSLQIMPDGGLKMCHWIAPFGNARKRGLHTAWKNRDRCWKKACSHLS